VGTVSSYEAKTHLSRLLKRAAQGEKITITRHGVSVATLVPPGLSEKESIRGAIQEIREFRKTHTLQRLEIKNMIEEGRRF
jgi:prevent-host-death family protein